MFNANCQINYHSSKCLCTIHLPYCPTKFFIVVKFITIFIYNVLYLFISFFVYFINCVYYYELHWYDGTLTIPYGKGEHLFKNELFLALLTAGISLHMLKYTFQSHILPNVTFFSNVLT